MNDLAFLDNNARNMYVCIFIYIANITIISFTVYFTVMHECIISEAYFEAMIIVRVNFGLSVVPVRNVQVFKSECFVCLGQLQLFTCGIFTPNISLVM